LISDYSSAPFDFILTGSPVILFTPDMDEFQQHSRSFYYDFDEIRPGPRTRNIAELKTALQTAIAKGNAAWKLEYDRALDRFHQYRDAESCQRTYSVIHQRFAQKEKL
jgi:CDP-glycerol glycerophosphotransferase